MKTGKFKEAAVRLHTHTVVFRTGSDEDIAAQLALAGQSTKAIMLETGLTQCQVIYRLHKAGVKRADFRNGTSMVAQKTLPYIRRVAAQQVKEKIAPKFAPLAVSRLNQ